MTEAFAGGHLVFLPVPQPISKIFQNETAWRKASASKSKCFIFGLYRNRFRPKRRRFAEHSYFAVY